MEKNILLLLLTINTSCVMYEFEPEKEYSYSLAYNLGIINTSIDTVLVQYYVAQYHFHELEPYDIFELNVTPTQNQKHKISPKETLKVAFQYDWKVKDSGVEGRIPSEFGKIIVKFSRNNNSFDSLGLYVPLDSIKGGKYVQEVETGLGRYLLPAYNTVIDGYCKIP